jgi:hypothetical protein
LQRPWFFLGVLSALGLVLKTRSQSVINHGRGKGSLKKIMDQLQMSRATLMCLLPGQIMTGL